MSRNLAFERCVAESVVPTLQLLLRDPNNTARAWAISSLTLIGRGFPDKAPSIRRDMTALVEDPSTAIRNRASKALSALANPDVELPKSWVKRVQKWSNGL